jgi:hypothetical protein
MRNAAVMFVIKNGLILGVSRGLGDPKFGLPGGKCEPGGNSYGSIYSRNF